MLHVLIPNGELARTFIEESTLHTAHQVYLHSSFSASDIERNLQLSGRSSWCSPAAMAARTVVPTRIQALGPGKLVYSYKVRMNEVLTSFNDIGVWMSFSSLNRLFLKLRRARYSHGSGKSCPKVCSLSDSGTNLDPNANIEYNKVSGILLSLTSSSNTCLRNIGNVGCTWSKYNDMLHQLQVSTDLRAIT